ncbi:hypothetical protein BLA29_000639 [Euroglyphus maynei]|uniref:Uncharacterized protein n=1 Tax=Euroglyphus maynei TaxID=6958 RepID=A0A1Y3APH9_EURMA|nr:hypothetical protein BLA29_000639 [Euroglyphus maynei]
MYRLKLVHIDEFDTSTQPSSSSSSQSKPKIDLYICRDCGFYNLKTKTFEYYWLSDADESDIDENCDETNISSADGDYCDSIDNEIIHNGDEIMSSTDDVPNNDDDDDEKESINSQSSDGSQNDELFYPIDSCQYD